MPFIQRVVSVACGWRHTACITESQNVYSWGRGTSGQLGHGDNVDRSVPKRLEALSKQGQAGRGLARSNFSADAGMGPGCKWT
jgi:alpha-tubulin suppressor-like RCC1 family protein